MIRIREITLGRGAAQLLREASAVIDAGERIALVGPNGCGKSTLLGALAGEIHVDAGSIEQPLKSVVRLEQTPATGEHSASRHVWLADPALVAAEEQLAQATHAGGMALAQAHDRWNELDAQRAPARIAELLAGLGFSAQQMDAPVRTLSGGWRMRLNLARALFAPGDLLLLDEPTNHLDLDGILWLERWLVRHRGTIVIVSHDRDFLDRVAQATLSIEESRLVRYAGGYSAFEEARAQRQAAAARDAREQAQQVEHLTRFINRFRAQATKARQVQSRLKALEKLASIATVRPPREIDFRLPSVGESPETLIELSGVDAGYTAATILCAVSLRIGRGARIGILGRNGAGKSTLVRTLTGELPPIAGVCAAARTLRVGYFAQDGIERLRGEESPLSMMQRLWPDRRELALRALLGRFGFSADNALRPIAPMSGGEKARLLLASIVAAAPQLLVLDEPTNHLDGQTRDCLTEALAEFDGALVVVSHDRHLMRASVDQLILVHAGGVSGFDGDLEDYAQWLSRGESAASAAAQPSAEEPARAARSEQRRLAAQQRQQLSVQLKPLKSELAQLETRLAELEKKLALLDAQLADPATYGAPERAASLVREHAQERALRESLETRWLELTERCETLARAAEEAAQAR
jgi:ATP-binding cassette, subfamily F, member 3